MLAITECIDQKNNVDERAAKWVLNILPAKISPGTPPVKNANTIF